MLGGFDLYISHVLRSLVDGLLITDPPPPLPSSSIYDLLQREASYHHLAYKVPTVQLQSSQWPLVVLRDATTKELYKVLTLLNFKSLPIAQQTAAPFGPDKGWSHYAEIPLYLHVPSVVTAAIEFHRPKMPAHIYQALLSVLYLQVVKHQSRSNNPMPAVNNPVDTTHWPSCLRCDAIKRNPPTCYWVVRASLPFGLLSVVSLLPSDLL